MLGAAVCGDTCFKDCNWNKLATKLKFWVSDGFLGLWACVEPIRLPISIEPELRTSEKSSVGENVMYHWLIARDIVMAFRLFILCYCYSIVLWRIKMNNIVQVMLTYLVVSKVVPRMELFLAKFHFFKFQCRWTSRSYGRHRRCYVTGNGIVMSPLRRHIFVCFMAKSAFWVFFGPSSVKRGRTHIVLGWNM